jgi:NAD(P)H-dependent FMN reductase
VCDEIGRWVQDRAQMAQESVDLIDLAEVALPFFDETEHPSSGKYSNAHTQRWSQRIASLDAFVLVTPEYNHSFSAPMKNALDYLSVEWNRKPVAFVGYGMTSAGTRAVQALVPVVVALGMFAAGAVYLPLRQRTSAAGHFQHTPSDDKDLDELLLELRTLRDLLNPEQGVASIAS